MRFITLTLLVIAAVLLTACGSASGQANTQIAKLPADIDVATAASLMGRQDVFLLDVRTQAEYDQGHIPDITLIPLDQVQSRLSEIPKDKTVVVTCRTGNRSAQAAQMLRQNGYTDVHNMQGGIVAWERAGYPVEK